MFLSKRGRPTGGKKWTWTRPFARPRPSSTSDEGGSLVPNSRLITAVIWISRTSWVVRGLSALHKQPRPPLRCDKDKATDKPNARRVGNGMEGASKTMGTLARNSLHHEWRAQKLEWVRGSNTSHGASGMRPRQVFERARVTAQWHVMAYL